MDLLKSLFVGAAFLFVASLVALVVLLLADGVKHVYGIYPASTLGAIGFLVALALGNMIRE
jgi:hypothetical protein